MITPAQAKTAYDDDQIQFIRKSIERQLVRGNRSVYAPIQYFQFGE